MERRKISSSSSTTTTRPMPAGGGQNVDVKYSPENDNSETKIHRRRKYQYENWWRRICNNNLLTSMKHKFMLLFVVPKSNHQQNRLIQALFFSIIVFGLIIICAYDYVAYESQDHVVSLETPYSQHRILHQNLPSTDKPQSESYSVFRSVSSSKSSSYYHHKHPRVIGFYFESIETESFIGTEYIDPNTIRLYEFGSISQEAMPEYGATNEDIRKQEHILYDSDEYRLGLADPFETKECVTQYEWQKSSQPSCNYFMELDMTSFPITHDDGQNSGGIDDAGKDSVRLIANGYWRDVWEVQTVTNQKVVLKTIRYEHDFEERNYDRHRRDAVAMERLTQSKYVMDIYSFCANSGFFEFADGGSVEDIVFYDKTNPKWNSQERLIVAHQLASGLAATHNSDKEGVPTISHADITPSQYVYVNDQGIFKLNDFNRARLLNINKNTGKICPYEVGNNPGILRSPEEYAYEPQTEKVDVYSLGNIYYSILTGLWPFNRDQPREAQKKIKAGERPNISDDIKNSKDPFDQAMIQAIYKCWVHDPKERASAREVQKYISDELGRLGVHAANPKQ